MSLLSLLHLLACSPHAPPAVAAEPIRVRKDVAYGDHPAQRLDLYTAPDTTDRPVVVFVHGGSWVSGDKDHLDQAPALVGWFLERGYAVAAPEFRHATPSPDASVGIDAMLSDVASSIGWLRTHGSAHGLRTDELVLVGFSSGAHLVSMLSTDGSWLASAGVPTSDVAAVVALDVHAYDVPLALEHMEGSEIQRNLPLIRHLFGEAAQQRRLSPASFIGDARVPPTLLVSTGRADRPQQKGFIAREASRTHRDRLRAHGHVATHLHLEDASHSSLVLGFGRPGHATTQAVAKLLAAADGPER